MLTVVSLMIIKVKKYQGENTIPSLMQGILEQFLDLGLSKLPIELPPLQSIHHQFNFVPNAAFF